MSEGAQIYEAIRQKKARRPDRTFRIGEIANKFMGEQVCPREEKY